MESKERSSNAGTTCIFWIQVVVVVLRFMGVIDWTWFRVFTPVWCYLGVCVLYIILITFAALLKRLMAWCGTAGGKR